MSFEDDEYWEAEYSDQAVGYADNTAIAHDRYAYVDRPVPSRRNGAGGGGPWADDADEEYANDELAVRRQRRQRNNAQSANREQRIRAAFDAERPSWLDDPAFASRGGRGGPRTGAEDRDPDGREDDWDTPAADWDTPTADWDEQADDWDTADDDWDAPAADWDDPRDRQPRRRAPEADVAGWDPVPDDGPIRRPGGRRTGGGPGEYDGAPSHPADRPASGRARVPNQPVSDAPLDLYLPPRRTNDPGQDERDGEGRRPLDARSGSGRQTVWPDRRRNDGDDTGWADEAPRPDGRVRGGDGAWADEPGHRVAPGRDDPRRGDRQGASQRPAGWADDTGDWPDDTGDWPDDTGWTGRADRETGWAEPADRETGWIDRDRETGWIDRDRETGWADRSGRERRDAGRHGPGQPRRDRQDGRTRPEERRGPRGEGDDRSRRGPADDVRRGGPPPDERRDDVLQGELLPPDPRRHRAQPGDPAAQGTEQYGAPFPGPGIPGWTGGPFPGSGFPGWTGPGFPGPWGPGFTEPGWDGPPWERPGHGAPGWAGTGRPPEVTQRDAAPLADRPAAADDDERWSPPPAARGGATVGDTRRDHTGDAEPWDDEREPYSGRWDSERTFRQNRAADPDRYDQPLEPAASDYDQPFDPAAREYDQPFEPASREYDQPLDPAARARRERGNQDPRGDDARGDERRAEPGPVDTGPRVLSKASPPTAPRVISKATPPPAPRVLKKAEPPATPRVVGTTPQVGPARVIQPAPPTVQPGMNPAATANPPGTSPAAAPSPPTATPAATGAPTGAVPPVSPAPAGAPAATLPAAASPDPRPASGVPGGTPAPRVRPPVPPQAASAGVAVPAAVRPPAPPATAPPAPPATAPLAPPATAPLAPPATAPLAPPATAPGAVPPPVVPSPAPAPPAVPAPVVPAAAAPPPAVPRTSPPGGPATGADRTGAAPASPAPPSTAPPPDGRPSVQTMGDVPLKPVARLATSGPDTTPRRYADAGLSGGWFTPHADAPSTTPDTTGAPDAATGDTAPSAAADRAAGAPGMVVDLDITDMLTNLATGQQPVVVPHPTLPADSEPDGAAGTTTAGRPEPSVMSRPEPAEPKTPVRPLTPLSAEDLAAIRWRLDGGTLREVVDDRDALRELGARLDEPLAGEADHATRAGLLSVRAEVYRLLDELGMAAAASRLALSHAESSGEVQAIVIAQAELAHVLRLRGDHAEADRLFEVAASSEAPPVLRSVVHENAGRSCFDQGRHMEALDHFARAIRLGDPEDLDLVDRIDVSLEAVYIHVLRDGWGPYPRLRRQILGEPADQPAATATG
ncbi:hypothetical protein [Krasilnikovia sp. M28-CT-15]|uniref:hypothetical protein n=1 Tax=Krasilnikovia sp. M28-CT-15 TaxID=3373540 RepID=UPI003876E852